VSALGSSDAWAWRLPPRYSPARLLAAALPISAATNHRRLFLAYASPRLQYSDAAACQTYRERGSCRRAPLVSPACATRSKGQPVLQTPS